MKCQVMGCTMPPSLLSYTLQMDVPEDLGEYPAQSYTTTILELELCPIHADEVADVEGRLLLLTAQRIHEDLDEEELGALV